MDAFSGENCQKCNTIRIVQIEHVENVGSGWKCHVCKRWNWLEKEK